MTESMVREKRIKPVLKCKKEFKEQLKASSCLVTVSVGQEVHEGEKFSATIDLVNNSFSNCTICVDDSLQRHTMSLGTEYTPDQLYEESIKEGDLWLERNKQFYSKLTISHTFVRWDHWLKHPNFNLYYNEITESYLSNKDYKEVFEQVIFEYLRRYKNRLSNPSLFDEATAYSRCLEYLKEECAALCLWAGGGYNFEVYPSKRNLAMQMTHEKFVLPKNPTLLHPVSIKFKNKKQLSPQKFSTNSLEKHVS